MSSADRFSKDGIGTFFWKCAATTAESSASCRISRALMRSKNASKAGSCAAPGTFARKWYQSSHAAGFSSCSCVPRTRPWKKSTSSISARHKNMSVVFWKELADHFSSRRFMILLVIIILSGLWAAYATGQAIRQNTETVPSQYAFLLLLTSSGETIFSLATFLGFFGPLVGITLGFDSISGEYARGTLSRVLSQPIYRDSFINGKFFAGLTTVAVLWGSILLLVIGLGTTILGFPPNNEEIWRMLIFTMVGVFYVGFWLALAMLFSLLFQKTVTAALASMAVWFFLSLFVTVVSAGIAEIGRAHV